MEKERNFIIWNNFFLKFLKFSPLRLLFVKEFICKFPLLSFLIYFQYWQPHPGDY